VNVKSQVHDDVYRRYRDCGVRKQRGEHFRYSYLKGK
jgi:hypothetical protein